MPLKTCASADFHPIQTLRPLACAVAVFATLASATAWAQNYPITQDQRATANLVAESGVPLHELAPNAPDSHTVKRGDTLWGISSIFLQSPWRWPELWGMNLQDIRNPHLIYPGQVLYLDKSGGRARLSTRRPGDNGEPQTVRVSPRTRYEGLSESAIPPISLQAIEAFLTEPLIVDEATFAKAPRIVATKDSRVLLSRGDRAYARSFYGNNAQTEVEPLSTASGQPRDYRVFRNAVPLKDPSTGKVLAYEAQYVGKAFIVRGESRQAAAVAPAKVQPVPPATQDVYAPQFERTAANIERDKPAAGAAAPAKAPEGEIVPATIDIVSAKEEMRVGDRLLPEPPREFPHYVPAAPSSTQTGQIVSVYGNAVTFAAQNQVVVINRGREHGIERGHVLALLSDSNTLVDKTDDSRPTLRLPGERNGLMMVFRTFDKVSYALVLQIADGVKVGDRFTNP